MKKLRSTLSLLLACALMGSLAACGGQAPQETTAAAETAAPETEAAESAESAEEKAEEPAAEDAAGSGDYAYIMDKGTMIVGFDDAFPPFSYQADDGKYDGFDLACAAELCKRWGIEIQYQPVAWSSKEQELNSKSIDIIWSGLGINEERLQVVSFSDVYCMDGGAIVTKKDSDIESLDDLAGRTVACQAGNGYIIRLDPAKVDTFGELIYQDTTAELLMQLDVGGCEAIIGDSVSFSYMAKQSGYDFKYIDIVADMGGEMSRYAVGCRLGSSDLVEKINETLHEMYEDGTLTKLSEEYLGGDYAVDCYIPDILQEARDAGKQ